MDMKAATSTLEMKGLELPEDVREEWFRFVNKCVEKGCTKCGAGRYSVVADALERLQATQEAILLSCGIRPSCRWFMQKGAAGCYICPQVTYLNYE